MKPITWVLYGIGAVAVVGLFHLARDQAVENAVTATTGETPAQYEASKRLLPATNRTSNVFDFDPNPATSASVANSIDTRAYVRVRPEDFLKSSVEEKCVTGFHHSDAPDHACLKDPDPFTNRTLFGNCPTGYVDNPRDPNTCTLPVIAARMLRPVE